jgi:hypothetical protein
VSARTVLRLAGRAARRRPAGAGQGPAADPLPELAEVEAILAEIGPEGRWEVLAEVCHRGVSYPIYAITLGTAPPESPILLLVGGIHGLERIGAEVVIAFLTTMVRQARWDELLRRSLEQVRVGFVPLVNPVGMALRRRANGNGVDLMRNAPPHAAGWGTPLVGGQRLSPWLPWYMGAPGAPMECELQAVLGYLEREVLPSRTAISVDVHSGFGTVDRIWFPYARTRKPLAELAELRGLVELLDQTLPHHVYRIEPQTHAYSIQGDLWDHVLDLHRAGRRAGIYLPLTLELGSWLWVKKNPVQAFTVLGTFNPVKPHRRRRTLRRHLPLFDFLRRAVASPHAWCSADEQRRQALRQAGFRVWFAHE